MRESSGEHGGAALAFWAPLARVAEWQTRQLQVLVSERAWGFKSPLAHDESLALQGIPSRPGENSAVPGEDHRPGEWARHVLHVEVLRDEPLETPS